MRQLQFYPAIKVYIIRGVTNLSDRYIAGVKQLAVCYANQLTRIVLRNAGVNPRPCVVCDGI